MKYTNNTSHVDCIKDSTVYLEAENKELQAMVRHLNFPIAALKHSIVGSNWSTRGRTESDFLHHIHMVVRGSASVIQGSNRMVMRPGFAYWIPGNCPVQRECTTVYEKFYIKFRCEWFEGVDLLLDWRDRKPVQLGVWKVEAWKQDWSKALDVGSYLRLQAQILLWITNQVPDLQKIIAAHIAAHARFEEAIRLIDENLSAKLSVSKIALAHGMSKGAFCMAFSRAFGVPPKTYVNRRLNSKIIERLLSSDERLRFIAESFGFSDEYYFSRFFTKMNGTSPMRYRRSVLEKF